MLAIILFSAVVIFIFYLIIDFFSTGNPNTFMDNWLKKTLWIWLPFVALKRLLEEIFSQKN